MDSTVRTALIAALTARGVEASVANQIRIVEDDTNSVRDLTPDKARNLLAMFGDMIQKYGAALHGDPVPVPRIVTAQRPFWERYRYKQHNGTQEMARRRRHMDRTKPWGNPYPGVLWTFQDGKRYTTDSHGQLCPFYS